MKKKNRKSSLEDRLSYLSFLSMGWSSPNPSVAALIVNDNRDILSEGFTQNYGGFHAEREAYLKSKKKIIKKNHSLYVTLEPCSHFGKTPPCTDLIKEYQPKKIYFGLHDPNPLVYSNQAIQNLKNMGYVILQTKFLKKISSIFLDGYLKRIQKKRPSILIKTVVSQEGFYCNLEKENIRLSNSITDHLTQLLRAKLDAVIVGSKTLTQDNPGLNLRTLKLVKKYKQPRTIKDLFIKNLLISAFDRKNLKFHNQNLDMFQPYRVFIVGKKKEITENFIKKQKFINQENQSKKVILFFLNELKLSKELKKELEQLTEKKIYYLNKEKEVGSQILEKLAELGINTLLVEGGNYLYNLFSNHLIKNDMVIKIHTEKKILQGYSPNINLQSNKPIDRISLHDNLWEIYRIK